MLRISGTAVQGLRHETDGIACQDAIAWVRRDTRVAAVLADGAGSAKFSRLGAQRSAKAVLALLSTVSASGDELARRAFIAARREVKQMARRFDEPIGAFACTLMFALSQHRQITFGQVGDGAIAIRDAQGRWRVLPLATRGEFANETVFVTSLGAFCHLRSICIPASEITACALMSDGAEMALVDRSSRKASPALETIASWVASRPAGVVNRALHDQFRSVIRQRTQDDASIVCLARGRLAR